MLAKKAVSKLVKDGLHPKLAHDHFQGPWKVGNTVREGLVYTVRLDRRRVR